jgi:hypothetical protein
MNKLREFSFPVLILGAWVLVSAYTLSSLGEMHARVQTAQMATLRAPAVEISATVPARQASLTPKAQKKKSSRRGPRV